MEPSLGKQVLSQTRTEPAFTLGVRRPMGRATFAPGPKYGHTSGVGKQVLSSSASAPAFGFGSSKRSELGRSAGAPGPDRYNLPSSVGKQGSSKNRSAPSFSMKHRTPSKAHTSINPQGPGECRGDTSMGMQTTNDRRTMPSFSFGSASRQVGGSGGGASPISAPGPGHYRTSEAIGKQVASKQRSAPSFSMSFRTSSRKKDADAVGPGRCRMDSSVGKQPVSNHRSAPGFTMRPKHGTEYLSTTPAPGRYEVPDAMGKQASSRTHTAPAFTMVSRKAPPIGGKDVTPGPEYNLGDSVSRQAKSSHKSAASFSFGSSKRTPLAKPNLSAPAPNRYAPPSAFDVGVTKGKGTKMSGRVKFGAMPLPDPKNPGPDPASYGAPHVEPRKAMPSYGFGTSTRDGKGPRRVDTVGPGSYDVTRKPSGPSYSLSGRTFSRDKITDVVGPGRCREDSAVGKQTVSNRRSAPGFSMGTRFSTGARKDEVPGPGSYGSMRMYEKSGAQAPRRMKRKKVVLKA